MNVVPRAERWRGKRVLVTGHTGFVGGWLCLWLAELGARVSGFALPPPTEPSFYARTGLEALLVRSTEGDLNDAAVLAAAARAADPQVVFHLAARAIVRDAWRDPLAAFRTNVMGTVHLLEICRALPALETLVLFTSDKVYWNDESGRACVEQDRLGGREPYSASKTGAEWAIRAYWESYLRRMARPPALATVRAGNILGGGDWGQDRLLPDAVRAFTRGRALVVRNPDSTRPWQHVLDAIRGTLVLAEYIMAAGREPGEIAWNLGPGEGAIHPVSAVAELAAQAWGEGAAWRHEADAAVPEAKALVLSSARAERELGWRSVWGLERAVQESVEWYRAERNGTDMVAFSRRQIEAHLADVS